MEGIYVVSEVIRFTERLLNTVLTSSTDVSLVLHSLLFYTWVSFNLKFVYIYLKKAKFITHHFSQLIDVESDFQLPFRTFCQPITVYMALFSPAPVSISLLCQLLCKWVLIRCFVIALLKLAILFLYRYSELGRKQLIAMSTFPELEEFLRDSLEDASMLNRFVIDTSSCLVYQKVLLGFACKGILVS